jgi:succinoglycan biosynthesis protein ExoM
LIRGRMASNAVRSKPMDMFKSAIAIAVYTVSLPLLAILGQRVFMKYLIKDCDHLGKILALLGIDVVKERYIGGY